MIFNLGSTAAAPTLTSIAVTTKPTKTSYEVGESFSRTGMIVTAYFDDGSSSVVTGYTVSPSTMALTAKSVTIAYTNEGITKTTTVAVTVVQTLYSYGVKGSLSDFTSVGTFNRKLESADYAGIHIDGDSNERGGVLFLTNPISLPAGATVTFTYKNDASGSGSFYNTLYASITKPNADKFTNFTSKLSLTGDHTSGYVAGSVSIGSAGSYYIGIQAYEGAGWGTSMDLSKIQCRG